MNEDEKYMKLALDLAEKGGGQVNPNPMVGAVIVKGGEVIASGYHAAFGQDHAEAMALKSTGQDLFGATMYVTLEPCSHHGKTPPCTKAIIKSSLSKVVIATLDPNPLVSGKGVAELQGAGVKVQVGVLKEEAQRQNEIFFKYITKGQPFVLMKVAMSLDGKITSRAGTKERITGDQAQVESHNLRKRYDAILVGIDTVIADDPFLTARLANIPGRNPARVILDSRGRIPVDSNLVNTACEIRTILVVSDAEVLPKGDELKEKGVEILSLSKNQGAFDLELLLSKLAETGIGSLIVEGGSKTISHFLKAGLVDKAVFFVSPTIIGGAGSLSFLSDPTVRAKFDFGRVLLLGEDLMVEAYPQDEGKICLPA